MGVIEETARAVVLAPPKKGGRQKSQIRSNLNEVRLVQVVEAGRRRNDHPIAPPSEIGEAIEVVLSFHESSAQGGSLRAEAHD